MSVEQGKTPEQGKAGGSALVRARWCVPCKWTGTTESVEEHKRSARHREWERQVSDANEAARTYVDSDTEEESDE